MLQSNQILSTDGLPKPSVVAPAPWTLTGNGYIFLYRFPKEIIKKNGFLSDYQQDSFRGLLGSIMFVDYHTTPVGPYQELLFIPGLFKMLDRNTFSISKIYVSSFESVWNGIENWGIPKEKCDFDIQKNKNNTDHLTASLAGNPFFEATLKRGKISFPLTTGIFPLRITQRLGNQMVYTKPSAKGKAYFAKLQDCKINSELFPGISKLKPLAVLVVENFSMTFPEAEFIPIL